MDNDKMNLFYFMSYVPTTNVTYNKALLLSDLQ